MISEKSAKSQREKSSEKSTDLKKRKAEEE